MHVAFDEIKEDSRVWIYLANRPLDKAEAVDITTKIRQFQDQWKAHGKRLRSSFKILYNQFIILAVDETFSPVSGCSIDESVHFLKQLEKEFNIELFRRDFIPFLFNDTIHIIKMSDLKNQVAQGIVDGDTMTFNPLVRQKKDLDAGWKLPAGSSWVQRYLNA